MNEITNHKPVLNGAQEAQVEGSKAKPPSQGVFTMRFVSPFLTKIIHLVVILVVVTR
ncbi:MAG: hypothetical protein GY934_16150 [Gammaproteobacteria bacterium]|nr:hypothetical protein [Gammaproteobacteria bacterium]